MDIILNAHPAIILAFLTVGSVVIFLAIWFLLKAFHSKASNKWPFIDRLIEKARVKGESNFIKKYGLIGLAVFMALPFPTIGVYGGTALCWVTGMKWWNSLIAVVSGATIYNGIILLSAFGIKHAVVSLIG